jgi:hypothetical protein
MNKKWRYAGLIYLICGLATDALLIYASYVSGAFQRHHTARESAIFAATLLATTAIWPYVVGVSFLLYFGILPI